MLGEIVEEIYKINPQKILYHYTSFQGLMGIAESKKFWVTEIRYLNDSEELWDFGSFILSQLHSRILESDPSAEVFKKFSEWLRNRIKNGPLVFVGSFTESGNLLSQWRGYSEYGRGVSLGFTPNKIVTSCKNKLFKIGQCIYDGELKLSLANRIIDKISKIPQGGEISGSNTSYNPHFIEIENDLMQISALCKSSQFSEEKEWRIVSPTFSNYGELDMKFRERGSMLIPYLELPLVDRDNEGAMIEQVIVGPSPNIELTMSSISKYLSATKTCYRISNSMSGYRY